MAQKLLKMGDSEDLKIIIKKYLFDGIRTRHYVLTNWKSSGTGHGSLFHQNWNNPKPFLMLITLGLNTTLRQCLGLVLVLR